jgi:hypothetical protein
MSGSLPEERIRMPRYQFERARHRVALAQESEIGSGSLSVEPRARHRRHERRAVVFEQPVLGLPPELEEQHVPGADGLVTRHEGPAERLGMRRREDGEGPDAVGMPAGHRPRYGAAPVVADEVGSLQDPLVEQGENVGHQLVHDVGRAAARPGPGRVAALVGGQCPVPRIDQGGHHAVPAGAVLREPVQQDDRLAPGRTSVRDVERQAVAGEAIHRGIVPEAPGSAKLRVDAAGAPVRPRDVHRRGAVRRPDRSPHRPEPRPQGTGQNILWGEYQMIGKLSARAYVLR